MSLQKTTQQALICPTCRWPFYFTFLRAAAEASLAAHVEREHPTVVDECRGGAHPSLDRPVSSPPLPPAATRGNQTSPKEQQQ